jgi:hypothetical protein
VVLDDATPLPVPGIDWQPASRTLVTLRPVKLRLRMGF